MLITDWSGIAFEFSFTKCKPVLVINTPMKIMNPEYQRIGIVPLNIQIRSEIGVELDISKLDKVSYIVDELMENSEKYADRINELVHEYIYNLDNSATVAGRYIANTIVEKIKGGKIK